jgi:hypothetical protein
VTGHRSDCFRTYDRPTEATTAHLARIATTGLLPAAAPSLATPSRAPAAALVVHTALPVELNSAVDSPTGLINSAQATPAMLTALAQLNYACVQQMFNR